MADFKAGLYTFLSTQGSLVALVDSRIYPGLAPATAGLPYITYQRLNEQEERHIGGLSVLTGVTYQFDLWGQTPQQAEQLHLAFKEALDGYRGLMGMVSVRQSIITSILDNFEEPIEGQTQAIWRHTVTADLWFHEP